VSGQLSTKRTWAALARWRARDNRGGHDADLGRTG